MTVRIVVKTRYKMLSAAFFIVMLDAVKMHVVMPSVMAPLKMLFIGIS